MRRFNKEVYTRRLILLSLSELAGFSNLIPGEIGFISNSPFRVPTILTFKPRLNCCKTFAVKMTYLQENKNNLHINGFALSLALKQRLEASRKSPE